MEVLSGKKVLSGAFWATTDRFVSMGAQFLTNLVLARILTPSDFGCIGMLTIFVVVSQTIIDGGFGSALIQKKEPTQTDYSTIFYWNILFSLGLYLILFVFAPIISSFYRMPLLENVLKVLGIILVVNALGVIQINRLRKQLSFKIIAIVNIVSYFISALVAIIMALNGCNVWSLVALQLLYSLLSVASFWVCTKWYPALCFSIQSLKELFSFGGFLLFSNILQEICKNLQGLIIGRRFSSVEMGLYAQAKKLGDVTSYTLPNVIVQVMFPVYSQLQSDIIRLRNTLRRNVRIISWFTFPIMILLILVAESLILFLYGDKWAAAIPYFQLLCIGGLFVCLQNINYYAIAALGKSRVLFGWSFYKWGMLLLLLLVGMHWGMVGILCGMIISELNIYVVNALLVSKYVHYSLLRQCLDLFPVLILSVLVGIVIYIGNCVWNLSILIQILFYLALYLSLSLTFYADIRKDVNKVVTFLIHKRNG